MSVPSVDVLAHHDGVDPNGPHHGGTMASALQIVIDLLAFVGTFGGSATFVKVLPRFGFPRGLGKQTQVILAVGVEGASVFGGGATASWRAPPLLTILGLVEPVWLHLLSFGADRDTFGGDLYPATGIDVLLTTFVQIDDRFLLLMSNQFVDGLGVMGGVEQDLVQRAQGETLRKFNRRDDKADGIMKRSRMQTRVQR